MRSTRLYAVIAYSAQKSSLHFLVVCSSRVAREISAPFYCWLLYYNFYGRGRRSLLRYGRNDEELRERTNERRRRAFTPPSPRRRRAVAAPSPRRRRAVAFASCFCPVSLLFSSAALTLHVSATLALLVSSQVFSPPPCLPRSHNTVYTSCGGHWQATEPFSNTSHIQYIQQPTTHLLHSTTCEEEIRWTTCHIAWHFLMDLRFICFNQRGRKTTLTPNTTQWATFTHYLSH